MLIHQLSVVVIILEEVPSNQIIIQDRMLQIHSQRIRIRVICQGITLDLRLQLMSTKDNTWGNKQKSTITDVNLEQMNGLGSTIWMMTEDVDRTFNNLLNLIPTHILCKIPWINLNQIEVVHLSSTIQVRDTTMRMMTKMIPSYQPTVHQKNSKVCFTVNIHLHLTNSHRVHEVQLSVEESKLINPIDNQTTSNKLLNVNFNPSTFKVKR